MLDDGGGVSLESFKGILNGNGQDKIRFQISLRAETHPSYLIRRTCRKLDTGLPISQSERYIPAFGRSTFHFGKLFLSKAEAGSFPADHVYPLGSPCSELRKLNLARPFNPPDTG